MAIDFLWFNREFSGGKSIEQYLLRVIYKFLLREPQVLTVIPLISPNNAYIASLTCPS